MVKLLEQILNELKEINKHLQVIRFFNTGDVIDKTIITDKDE
ncbi:hypothetical protein [Amedibacillus sp. YH-ame10]